MERDRAFLFPLWTAKNSWNITSPDVIYGPVQFNWRIDKWKMIRPSLMMHWWRYWISPGNQLFCIWIAHNVNWLSKDKNVSHDKSVFIEMYVLNIVAITSFPCAPFVVWHATFVTPVSCRVNGMHQLLKQGDYYMATDRHRHRHRRSFATYVSISEQTRKHSLFIYMGNYWSYQIWSVYVTNWWGKYQDVDWKIIVDDRLILYAYT